jgi:hypothetical protein
VADVPIAMEDLMSRIVSTVAFSVILGCSVLFGASPAEAVKIEDFEFNQTNYETDRPQIHVKFDLQADNWNAVTDAKVTFKYHYKATLRKVSALVIGSDLTVKTDNMTKTLHLQSASSGNEMFFDSFQLSKSANKLGELKNKAINTCRQIRSNGGKPNKQHVVPYFFYAEADLQVYTATTNYDSANLKRLVAVSIVCDANPAWHEPIKPVGGVATDTGEFKIQSVDLFLTTFQGAETNPTPGNACKKLKVTVRIFTSGKGIVGFKLSRHPGQDVTKQNWAEFQTKGKFKGRFMLEETFVHTFDKTTNVQYMAEVGGGTFPLSTPWKEITIHCGGGLTNDQPSGPNDLIPSFKVISTELSIIGTGDKGCPAKAFIAATFITNKPGKFRYFIGTSVNKNKSGELEAKKVGNIYRAQETMTLDIVKSGKLVVHARAVDFPASSAFANKPYNCTGVKPVQGVTTTVN